MASSIWKNRQDLVLPAVAIVVVTWLVFWMAQGFPTICNLVAPCPGRDVRVAPAFLFGGMMLAPLGAVILMSFVRSPPRWIVQLLHIILVLLAVVGYGVISFSGGFGVTAGFLLGLLGICGTAVLAHVRIIAQPRRAVSSSFAKRTDRKRFQRPRRWTRQR